MYRYLHAQFGVNILPTDLIIAKAFADRLVAMLVRRFKGEGYSMDIVQLSISPVFGSVAVSCYGYSLNARRWVRPKTQ